MTRFLLWLAVFAVLGAVTVFSVKSCAPQAQRTADTGKQMAAAQHAADRSAGQANLAQLRGAVNSFQAQNGRFPNSLDELVSSGLLPTLPAGDFRYDASTGQVTVP